MTYWHVCERLIMYYTYVDLSGSQYQGAMTRRYFVKQPLRDRVQDPENLTDMDIDKILIKITQLTAARFLSPLLYSISVRFSSICDQGPREPRRRSPLGGCSRAIAPWPIPCWNCTMLLLSGSSRRTSSLSWPCFH